MSLTTEPGVPASVRAVVGSLSDKQVRRVVLSGYLGSTVEFYDFILYATAASVIFAPVFFSGLSPAVALIASYGTFATGYVSRPLGGIVFGHFGDRIGRKRMLIVTMSMMGLASFLIGLVPATPTLGPVLLVVLRAVQGIAVGGEWGGAALMSLEHARGRERGFAAAFSNAGAPTGALLGTIALTLASLLPARDFLAWGWRVPFLLSAVLLGIGLWIRSRITESPLFTALPAERAAADAAAGARRRVPLLAVLRQPRKLLAMGLGCAGSFVIQGVFSTFAINYSVRGGISPSQALAAFALSQFLAIFAILYAGHLSDRYGRRPVMLGGLLALMVLAYPLLAMIGSGHFAEAAAGFVIALSVCQALTFGPLAAFVSEQFGTTARYTGASLGYQVAALLGAGFTPTIVAALAAAAHGGISLIIAYVLGVCLLSALALLFLARESKDIDLAAGA